MASNTYTSTYAPTGRAKCKDKDCKETIEKGALRISVTSPRPENFGGDGDMTKHYHAKCWFNAQTRMRPGSKKVTATSDLEGFSELKAADQKKIQDLIKGGGGDDDDDDGGDKKKAKKTTKRKASKKKGSDDEDEEDEEDEKPKKKKAKTEKKEKKEEKKKPKKKKKGSDDEDEEDDEDEKPKKKPAKKAEKKSGGGGGGGGKARMFEMDSKFWEIAMDGDTLTIRFGVQGKNGTTQVKNLGSEAAAKKEYDKLIRQKTNKGYEEQ